MNLNCSQILKSLILLSLVSIFFHSSLQAQVFGTASHTVTVNVPPLSVIQVDVGTINLNMTGANAIAGQDQMTVIDQSSRILWGTNSSLQRITIQTSLLAPKFEIYVEALAPTAGSARTPAFLLTSIAESFITGIGRSSGSASIRYTGIALASQGTGTDSHVITFTIQAE